MRDILNGYVNRYGDRADEFYIEAFNRIKDSISGNDSGREYRFEWLNVKPIRNVIKSWAGEPFDVLGHLARHGYIEQAVRRKIKLDTNK